MYKKQKELKMICGARSKDENRMFKNFKLKRKEIITSPFA